MALNNGIDRLNCFLKENREYSQFKLIEKQEDKSSSYLHFEIEDPLLSNERRYNKDFQALGGLYNRGFSFAFALGWLCVGLLYAVILLTLIKFH